MLGPRASITLGHPPRTGRYARSPIGLSITHVFILVDPWSTTIINVSRAHGTHHRSGRLEHQIRTATPIPPAPQNRISGIPTDRRSTRTGLPTPTHDLR